MDGLIKRLRDTGDNEAADEIETLRAQLDKARRADTRSITYRQGQRNAQTWAVEWLHHRARCMNDSHAQDILNVAAFYLGIDGSRRFATKKKY